MGSDAIWEKLMSLSIVAGMNQRYSQYMLTKAEWFSSAIDVAVVVFTMLTLVFGVAAYYKPGNLMPLLPYWWSGTGWGVWRVKYSRMAIAMSLFAALSGVVLVVVPTNKSVHFYSTMLQSWSDLRQDIDSAIVDSDSHTLISNEHGEMYLERRYRDLLAKKNALNAREPSPDQELLEHFLTLEERSRSAQDEIADQKPVALRE